jgi:hypothetical protein
LSGLTDAVSRGKHGAVARGLTPPVTFSARLLVLSRHGVFVVRGHDVHAARPCNSSLFACTGGFRADDFVHDSGLFTLGSVDVKRLCRSVVVCGGDLIVRQEMVDCIVVAGGKVSGPTEVMGRCTVIAGGEVVVPKKTRPLNVAIKEKQSFPLESLGFSARK